MKYRVVVRPEADDDLQAAEAWYERQRTGLGREFLQATMIAIESLSQNPLHHRIRHRKKLARWVYPRRFPYRIVFRVAGATIVIYAVLHAARHDRFWQKRLRA